MFPLNHSLEHNECLHYGTIWSIMNASSKGQSGALWMLPLWDNLEHYASCQTIWGIMNAFSMGQSGAL